MRIGVDLMGSESSPRTLYQAVLAVAERAEDSDTFVVYATENAASEFIDIQASEVSSKVDLRFTSDFITMDDEPLSAVRFKKEASLAVGIRQLQRKEIDAFVTAGNTGALIASAVFSMPLLQGFERTSLLAILPTQNKPLAMVDVGGSLAYDAKTLVQYAHLGAAYQRCSLGIEIPTIGLLNIGAESKKGTPEIREAYRILEAQSRNPEARIRFLGNIEGREAFQGKVDVLVTDGFTGNVLLKTTEGISSFIFDYLQKALKNNPSKDLHESLNSLQSHFDYEEYPGALVCGIDGIVIKCHGAVSSKGMQHSILEAMTLVKNGLLNKLKDELKSN